MRGLRYAHLIEIGAINHWHVTVQMSSEVEHGRWVRGVLEFGGIGGKANNGPQSIAAVK
jgi:hypothetical protein